MDQSPRARRNPVALSRVRLAHCLVAAAALLAITGGAGAQDRYRAPAAEIVKILDAPPLPGVSLSPDRTTMLLLDRRSMPGIADLAQPMERLAGRRLNPAINGPHGARPYTGITIKRIANGREVRVELPPDNGLSSVTWAPDGSRFAFLRTVEGGVELWVADAATGRARALTGANVNAISIAPNWLPDSRRLLIGLIPEGRGEAPRLSAVPTGPTVQENMGGDAAPVRTYQDLLKSAHDEAMFDHYFKAQLTLIDAASGEKRRLGAPAAFLGADPSPAGEQLLVERVVAPYSYLVPMWSFPQVVEVWGLDGRLIKEIARIPLAERVPIEGVITGPRSHRWRDTDGSAEIFWVEALDGGDPRNKVSHRDKLMALASPFTAEPREVARFEHRFSGLRWLESPAGTAMANEYDRDRRWARTWLIDADRAGAPPRLVWDRSIRDRYGDPGSPVTMMSASGRSVVMVEDGAIYLTGSGATPEGDRPFIDRMNLATLETERLWRNEGERYETVIDPLTRDGARILTRAETATEPPNYVVRDLAAGEAHPVTDFKHPAPELLGVRKELVTYDRNDGVTLSATLYLPPGYKEGERLPLIVWAYPYEFNDPYTASQVSGSPHRFTMFAGSSHLFLLTQGYAIMDSATMPVVGADPETVNDTFIDQIVASARAAIDKAAAMGVADPNRVGVGGHSYGAFMTANLLAHCDLFRAGIARSGAYNRTLTPFGFQGERRTLWEAPDVYSRLSPFMHADKINEPLLMIHGEVDNNSGTFPMQSERLFHAVKGHGGYARLVTLPHESHGYVARESVMHVLAEMCDWFDAHVKYAPERGGSAN